MPNHEHTVNVELQLTMKNAHPKNTNAQINIFKCPVVF